MRQQETRKLAAENDVMIVIGGRHSSNTAKLFEICRASCPSVLIETARELPVAQIRAARSIGVTAGASTPGWIIKEGKNKMSEERFEIEESFAEMLEKSIKTLNTGDKVVGVVVNVTPTEIQVDLGTKHAGYIKQDYLGVWRMEDDCLYLKLSADSGDAIDASFPILISPSGEDLYFQRSRTGAGIPFLPDGMDSVGLLLYTG